jgi:hypothetical protein
MSALKAFWISLLLALQPFAYSQNSSQQTPNLAPKQLGSTDLIEAMSFVRNVTILGLQQTYKVDGDMVFVGQTLAADTIIFGPKSSLIFTGERSPRYIITRKLVLPPKGAAATISWLRDSAPATGSSGLQVPPQDSKAASGSIGGGEGADGTVGGDGHTGNPGYPGRDAPTVYIFAGNITGGAIKISLGGLDGGPGGKGQDGGDGGPGRTGSQGVSSIADCKAGGGNGGNGGRGGTGGKGGPGGRGGDGGTVVLLSSSLSVLNLGPPDAGGRLEVNAPGGKGGPGGPGGDAGAGGPGGAGGSGSAFCKGGSPGSPGASGVQGPVGDVGRDGTDGSFWVTSLTGEQIKNLGIQ